MIDANPLHLGNKYIFLDLIGVGGMAEVYRCKLSGQKGFEKIVVLKRLLPQVTHDTAIVDNFIDEARLSALLQHENIAHVFDFGELDGNYFIAMEYLFGKDLHTIINQAKESGKPIGVENSLLIASKICEGMEYAHNLKDLQQRPLNIIHRDLSPHNVFVTYDGKVKIIDFGIAKAELFDNRTKVGFIKGKVSYMSPEQLSEKQIDRRSDIFSIGILLYEMLSGHRLFTGDSASLIRKCLQADFEKLEDVCPGLHPDVYHIVDRALQKERSKRFQTCSEMREAIELCLYAIRPIPKTQDLKEYILQLFEHIYKNEKQTLIATIERSDVSNPVGKLKTSKAGMSWPLSGNEEDRTVIMVNQGTTLNSDPSSHGKGTFFDKIMPLRGGGRRIVLAGFLLCCLAVVILESLSLMRVRGNVEEGHKVEVSAVQQSQAEREKETNTPLQLEQPEQARVVNQVRYDEPSPQQRQIIILLDRAERALEGHRLTRPVDDSALSYYQKVLEIEPDNNVAQDGIRQVAEKYSEFAEKRLAEGNIIDAEVNVQRGLTVYPQSGRLLSLKRRIEKTKKELIKNFELKALRSMEKDDLTSPPDDCAYKYYQAIEELDNNSAITKAGMVKIANRYAFLADKAYRNLQLANAREYVARGLKVQPDNSRLLGIKQDLSRSKPGIFFRMLEKNIHTVIK